VFLLVSRFPAVPFEYLFEESCCWKFSLHSYFCKLPPGCSLLTNPRICLSGITKLKSFQAPIHSHMSSFFIPPLPHLLPPFRCPVPISTAFYGLVASRPSRTFALLFRCCQKGRNPAGGAGGLSSSEWIMHHVAVGWHCVGVLEGSCRTACFRHCSAFIGLLANPATAHWWKVNYE